jgi:hypothetical protein
VHAQVTDYMVETIALILLPVAVLMCGYALTVFIWRARAIAKKQVGPVHRCNVSPGWHDLLHVGKPQAGEGAKIQSCPLHMAEKKFQCAGCCPAVNGRARRCGCQLPMRVSCRRWDT